MKKTLLLPIILIASICLISCSGNTYDADEETVTETDGNYNYEDVEKNSVDEESENSEILYESLPEPQVIYADFEVTTNPDGSFSISTNLPDETELSLSLKGRGYLAQSETFVEKGIAISERFTDKGNQLVGDYTLEVLMPIPSVQSDYVKHFIGENGEYLEGPYVKGALGSVIVSKEFEVSFPRNGEIVDKSSENTAVADNPTADGNYYRTPYGEKYHLDPNCGGKNSYLTTNISGLSPCSKCAD